MSFGRFRATDGKQPDGRETAAEMVSPPLPHPRIPNVVGATTTKKVLWVAMREEEQGVSGNGLVSGLAHALTAEAPTPPRQCPTVRQKHALPSTQEKKQQQKQTNT